VRGAATAVEISLSKSAVLGYYKVGHDESNSGNNSPKWNSTFAWLPEIGNARAHFLVVVPKLHHYPFSS
jgi:hypothetical protein